MLFGPIFSFDLVARSRRKRFYLARTLYASFLLFLVWFGFAQAELGAASLSIQQAAMVTQFFFYGFVGLQLVAVLILGPAVAAGTIALERERRTIEYLFVTDLTNAEIIGGKFAARLLYLMSLVAVGVPVLAISMLMGGISPEELASVFIVTLSTMVAVVSLSVAVSVSARRARDAVMRTYLAVFALLVLPTSVSAWMAFSRSASRFYWIDWAVRQMVAANPFSFFAALALPGSLWQEAALTAVRQLAFSATCIGFALFALRRMHIKAAGRSPKPGRYRALRWRRKLGDRPMLWKELFADSARSRFGLAGRLIMWVGAAWILVEAAYDLFMHRHDSVRFRTQRLEDQMIWTTSLICLGLLVMGARAATSVAAERDRQCWEPLLLTSLTAREIVSAKILGSLYSARGLGIFLGLLWIIDTIALPTFAFVIPFELVTIAAVALFVGALGVFYSLVCKESMRALGATVATLLFCGGGYLIFFAIVQAGDELILGGCIPFLIAVPTVFYLEGAPHGRHDDEILLAYLLGTAFYFAAAFGLWAASIGRTEREPRGTDALAGVHTRPILLDPPPDQANSPRNV